jgi:hypothetical protein
VLHKLKYIDLEGNIFSAGGWDVFNILNGRNTTFKVQRNMRLMVFNTFRRGKALNYSYTMTNNEYIVS